MANKKINSAVEKALKGVGSKISAGIGSGANMLASGMYKATKKMADHGDKIAAKNRAKRLKEKAEKKKKPGVLSKIKLTQPKSEQDEFVKKLKK